MATNLEIEKNPNENTASLLRRFSKQVRESGIINRARGLRFYERTPSKFKKKEKALKRIAKKQEMEKLRKLGRI